MKRIQKQMIGLLLVLVATSIYGQKDSPSELLRIIIENNPSLFDSTQIAVAIIDDQTISYDGICVGKDTNLTIDNSDHLFEIGSLSKIVVSSAYARMAEELKIDPDDLVFKYMKYKAFRSKDLRVRHLLNHTSGLPRLPSNMDLQGNLMDPYATYNHEKLHHYLKKECTLSSKPGVSFEYSNIGMAIITEILKKKSKKDFKSIIRSYVYNPLNMNKTYSFVENAPDIIQGIGPNGQKMNNWHFQSLAPAGSIISSSKDLAKLAYSYLHETDKYQLLLDSTFQLSPQMNLGLGWFIIKKENKKILYHNGRTGGYSSCMVIDPTNKKAIVVLSNISGLSQQANVVDAICLELLDSLNNDSNEHK